MEGGSKEGEEGMKEGGGGRVYKGRVYIYIEGVWEGIVGSDE